MFWSRTRDKSDQLRRILVTTVFAQTMPGDDTPRRMNILLRNVYCIISRLTSHFRRTNDKLNQEILFNFLIIAEDFKFEY